MLVLGDTLKLNQSFFSNDRDSSVMNVLGWFCDNLVLHKVFAFTQNIIPLPRVPFEVLTRSLTWQSTPIFYCQPAPLCACMRLTTQLLSMTGEVAATLAVGHRLRGKVGSYKVLEQFTKDRDVWKAM